MGRQRCLPGRTDGQTLSNLLQNLVWPRAGSAFRTGPSRGPHRALTGLPPASQFQNPAPLTHVTADTLGHPTGSRSDAPFSMRLTLTTHHCKLQPPQSPPFPCSIYFPVALIFEHAT